MALVDDLICKTEQLLRSLRAVKSDTSAKPSSTQPSSSQHSDLTDNRLHQCRHVLSSIITDANALLERLEAQDDPEHHPQRASASERETPHNLISECETVRSESRLAPSRQTRSHPLVCPPDLAHAYRALQYPCTIDDLGDRLNETIGQARNTLGVDLFVLAVTDLPPMELPSVRWKLVRGDIGGFIFSKGPAGVAHSLWMPNSDLGTESFTERLTDRKSVV